MNQPLLHAIKLADGGRVECVVNTSRGAVTSVIERSFFEDFTGNPNPQLTPKQQERIITTNAEWLATEAERQLSMGFKEVVIR